MGWIPIILFSIIGFATLVLLQFPPRRIHLAGTATISFFAGLVISTFFISIVGVLTGKLFFFIFWILLAASICVLIWKRSDTRAHFPDQFKVPSKPDYLLCLAVLPLLYLITVNIYQAVSINLSFGIVGIDALGNFGMKAKLWYFTHDIIPELLRNPEYITFKRGYPPIIPMSEAMWCYIIGDWNDVADKWLFVAFWIGGGGLIFAIVHGRSGSLAAWLACTLWFILPLHFVKVEEGALSGYVDAPMGVVFLLGVWLIGEIDAKKKFPQVILYSLLMAGIFWVKREGLPFFCLAMAILIWKRTPWKTLLTMVVTFVVFYIIYAVMKQGLPTHLEKLIQLFDHPLSELKYRFRAMFRHAWLEYNTMYFWGEKLWYAFMAVWIFKLIKGPWRQIFSYEMIFIVCFGGLYTTILFFSYYNFDTNFDFVAHRLYYRLYPLLIVATFTGYNLKFDDFEKNIVTIRTEDDAN